MSSVPVEAADLDWIDALARAEDGQAAMGLLSRLPADQRDVVTARVLQEREYDEIAAAHHGA
jgi:DNA-directed RNA polymerase specialized sigma24 family protein